jgi:hypothetical protein
MEARSAESGTAEVSWLARRLLRTGFRRGLEGSRGWLYVGMSVAALRVARRLLVEPPETVFETELKPGEAIQVRTIPPPAREGTRARR